MSIKLFYHHNSLHCFVNVQTSGQIEEGNTTPDNIMECLEPWLQDYTTEEKTFTKMLENEKHDQMFGTVLAEFEIKNGKKYSFLRLLVYHSLISKYS